MPSFSLPFDVCQRHWERERKVQRNSYAIKAAKRIAKAYNFGFGNKVVYDDILAAFARQHQVGRELIPFTVELTKSLLRAM